MTPHTIDRRAFLAATAATAAGLVATRPASAADDFAGFSVGVQSYTFRNFELEQALKRTKELGLKSAEFYSKHIPPNSSPDALKAILKLCKEYDVTPMGFGVSGFSDNHDANKKLFEFGKALGIKYLSADPAPDKTGSFEKTFESLDKLCEEYKIAIAIHPHGPSGKGRHRWWSAEIILKAVKDHHKLIGTCLDTGHLIRMDQLGERLDPAEQVKVMGERNFAMHLKDHDNKKKTDVVFGSPEGRLDIPAVLKALKAVKFTGHIAIEYEANPNDPSPDVKKCVAFLKQSAGKLG
ncbi:MAG: sugar phosphate isomerase/epimerase [Planctomycetia bacterium]|nr:sugar phosphate isomerase/epimerase [Planctomycetia bacterium]